MKPVFVFKTSVASRAQINHVKPLLDNLMLNGDRWNFDLEDCDNILRVESGSCHAEQVIKVLEIAGYGCEELQ